MPHHLEVGSRLVVASHNPGKAWEIQQLIARGIEEGATLVRVGTAVFGPRSV